MRLVHRGTGAVNAMRRLMHRLAHIFDMNDIVVGFEYHNGRRILGFHCCSCGRFTPYDGE